MMPRANLVLAWLCLCCHLAAAMPTELPSILQVWDGGMLQWSPKTMPRANLALAWLCLCCHLDAAAAIAMPTEVPSILQVWDGGTLQWSPRRAGSVQLRPEPREKRGVLDRVREHPGKALFASLLSALVVVLNVITS